MNKICKTCRRRTRLQNCVGKDGDFKYCYRKKESYNTQQVKKLSEIKIPKTIDKQSLKLTNFSDIGLSLLYGNNNNLEEELIGYIVH